MLSIMINMGMKLMPVSLHLLGVSCVFCRHSAPSLTINCALSFSWVLPDSVPMGSGLWKLNVAGFGGGCQPHQGFLAFFGSIVSLFFVSFAVVGHWEIPY